MICITFDIAVGIEWKRILEKEQRNVVQQLPLILPKCCQFVFGHHLRLLQASVIQNELPGSHHCRRKHISPHLLQIPI